MKIVFPLFLGYIIAFVGIMPPGLINMTAVKVNLKEGVKSALWFILGAVFVIFFQTYLAVLFARSIEQRPRIMLLLREIGFVLFFLLSIYFLVIAKKSKIKKGKIKKHSSTNRFFLGILLSALNFFPIPYYVFICLTLGSYGLFLFQGFFVLFFVIGVVLGSFSVFYFYIHFFKRIEVRANYILNNMNTVIGSITGIVAGISLINIIKYYWF